MMKVNESMPKQFFKGYKRNYIMKEKPKSDNSFEEIMQRAIERSWPNTKRI